MLISIKKLMQKRDQPLHLQGVVDLSGRDFPYYTVTNPAAYTLDAEPEGNALRLSIVLEANISAQCARCLDTTVQLQCIEKQYVVREEDFAEEFPELPITPEGLLDLPEMLYQELLMEVPLALLCSEDCKGLCSGCGKKRDACSCIDALIPEPDVRWKVLHDILDEE